MTEIGMKFEGWAYELWHLITIWIMTGPQVDVPTLDFWRGATIDILMRLESLPSITSYLSNLLRNALWYSPNLHSISSLNCVVIQQRILLCQSINFRRSQNHNWSIIQSSSVLSNYFLFEAVKRWTNQSHPSCLVTKEDVYIHE